MQFYTGHSFKFLECQQGHKHLNYKCQTNGHDLTGFNVNRGTQACKLSMPNQWAQSQRLQCQQGHKHVNCQRQTNGHDLIGFNVNRGTQAHELSMPNQLASSYLYISSKSSSIFQQND